MSEMSIKVENVSKKYSRSLKRSMIYGISDITRNVFGLSSHPDKLRKNEFWALKDLAFELNSGEVLGIIGPNGSGKSTMLKLLNGIFWPDKGKITIRGRVGALIEVGAGFHPLLTGRENIFLNGSILGMSKAEILKKFDEIVEFAGIEDFLDTPVKHYSSGMFVRLGFSIASHSDPDILLIDEVLAVGDLSFRRKCYNKIDEIKNKCAIVLVSHNMFQIGRVCSKALYLNNGIIQSYGPVNSVISEYYNQVDSDPSFSQKDLSTTGAIRISDYSYKLENNSFKIDIEIEKDIDFEETEYIVNISFTDATDLLFAQANSLYAGEVFSNSDRLSCEIPDLNLNSGKFFVNIVIFDAQQSRYFSMYRKLFAVTVEKEYIANANIHYDNAVWSRSKVNKIRK